MVPDRGRRRGLDLALFDPLTKEAGMIARLATALIAGALLLPAASAQAQPTAPGPAALDLARLLMSRDQSLYDDADLARFRSRLESALLGSEGSCSQTNTDCQAAAAAVALQYAPALRQIYRERSERLIAETLAARLRPEELVHVAAWVRGEEGSRFLDAWASLHDPEAAQRRRRELQRDLVQTSPSIFNPARALFRQRTRNLPQPAPR
jgi:hypothetical protein